MRTGATLFPYAPTPKAIAPQPTTTVERSPWHSPVPYLFGGLAAMLGLIAFALLILACSYYRLSRRVNGAGNDRSQRDVEAAEEKGESSSDTKALPVFDEKFLVIMAGDMKPTFLATPIIISKACASFNGARDGRFESKEGQENENKVKDIQTNENHTTVRVEGNGEVSQESNVVSQEQSN